MSKVKATGKKHYEMLYIVSNKFTEDEVEPIVEKIHKAITDNGGEITYTENWGKKKMTYQIKGFSHGYYRLVEFNLDGVKLAEIDRGLRMSTDILRHQTVTRRQRTAEEIEADKLATKKMMDERKKEMKEMKESKEPKEVREEKPVKEKNDKNEKPAKSDDKKKVDLKDLDDKLDKILESDNLL
jgi:small subunit ribosomal protein S6